MKIKIDSDVYDIVNRIKEIDDGYFIVFDTRKMRYEIHNSNQINSYCLMLPFDEIDSRCIDLILMSCVEHIDIIIEDIDKNNYNVENNNTNNVKSQADFMVREIYQFCNNSSKNYNINKAFGIEWR